MHFKNIDILEASVQAGQGLYQHPQRIYFFLLIVYEIIVLPHKCQYFQPTCTLVMLQVCKLFSSH